MRIGIIGCGGRMGKTLINQVITTDGCEISGGNERQGSPLIGKDIGVIIGLEKLGINISDTAETVVQNSDAVIDFTVPESTMQVSEIVAKYGKAHIIGTTGLSDAQKNQLRKNAENSVTVLSPNMSIGVNLLMSLTEKLAAILDETYDIEIVEMHHRHKIDAPSGTALGLGEAAAKGRNVALSSVWNKSRDGNIGARKSSEIGFATLRGGDVVGDHTVIFASDGERIELSHKASSRTIFAKGAVHAALWSKGKTNGFYTMRDVISGI